MGTCASYNDFMYTCFFILVAVDSIAVNTALNGSVCIIQFADVAGNYLPQSYKELQPMSLLSGMILTKLQLHCYRVNSIL